MPFNNWNDNVRESCFPLDTGQTEEVPAVKGGTTGFLLFCFFLRTLTAFHYNFNTHSTWIGCSPKAAVCNCSNTPLQDWWWQWPSDQCPAALRSALLQQPLSQWGCSSKSTSGRRLCSNMCFGNTDLPRFHSNQCHPHSKRHLCDRCVTVSWQRITEAKPVCSEAPKLQEQLQSHPQAAELGHRTGAFTLH